MICCLQCQTALMVTVDCAMGLEDPFDDTALDALSLFEALGHISAVCVRVCVCLCVCEHASVYHFVHNICTA